jgi:adenylate cyclase class 2
MKEIEVKILDIDRQVVESRLKELGARLTFEDEISALFFDSPGGLIAGARNLLRLRREGSRVKLTFKEYVPSDTVKVRQEYETEVADFKAMQAILQHLGLHPVLSVRKHRTTYDLPGARFSFDRHVGKLDYIPEFLEIEADSAEALARSVALLGFATRDCRAWGLPELVAHYTSPVRDH